MTLTEIENLNHDELKQRRKELSSIAATADPTELAERYIRARTDAKQRDTKLAEQGEKIAALETQLGELSDRDQQQQEAIKGLEKQLDVAHQHYDNVIRDQQKQSETAVKLRDKKIAEQIESIKTMETENESLKTQIAEAQKQEANKA